MRYLVTFENIEPGPLLPPQQVVGLIRSVVFPTEEALARLESEGKVRGGVTAGARAGAFILDADSHDEANQIVQTLPAWGIVKMQLTPLVSFAESKEIGSPEAPSRVIWAPLCWRLLCLSSCGPSSCPYSPKCVE